MKRAVLLVGVMAVGCIAVTTQRIELVRPSDGARAICGETRTTAPVIAAQIDERTRACVHDYQRAGYERVPNAPAQPQVGER